MAFVTNYCSFTGLISGWTDQSISKFSQLFWNHAWPQIWFCLFVHFFPPKSAYTTYIVLNLNNGNCFASIFFKASPCSQFSTVPHWAKSPSSTFEGKNRLAQVLKQQFTEKKDIGHLELILWFILKCPCSMIYLVSEHWGESAAAWHVSLARFSLPGTDCAKPLLYINKKMTTDWETYVIPHIQ